MNSPYNVRRDTEAGENAVYEVRMRLEYEHTGSAVIVYDADCIEQPAAELFAPDYWREMGAVSRTAMGRALRFLIVRVMPLTKCTTKSSSSPASAT